MSNLKNIGNKLFKETTELKSQKVELGLSNDLKKLVSESDKIIKVVDKYSIDLSRLFREVKDFSDEFNKINDKRKVEAKNGKSILQEINSLLDKTQRQAKELGIEPRDIPNFSKASTSSNELRAVVNDFQKYSNFNI